MKNPLEVPFEEVAAFHGHVCPGLAMGYLMTRAALKALATDRSRDEDLVAVVETDACGVDAVQYLAGCTAGKGNLVFREYGKHAFTFHHRASGRAVRVTLSQGEERRSRGEEREERIRRLLAAPEGDVVSVREVSAPVPPRARIRNSVTCEYCGERTMEIRARVRDGKVACIPCAEGE